MKTGKASLARVYSTLCLTAYACWIFQAWHLFSLAWSLRNIPANIRGIWRFCLAVDGVWPQKEIVKKIKIFFFLFFFCDWQFFSSFLRISKPWCTCMLQDWAMFVKNNLKWLLGRSCMRSKDYSSCWLKHGWCNVMWPQSCFSYFTLDGDSDDVKISRPGL